MTTTACPVCRAAHVVEISLTIRERSVLMRSCSRCDSRWWHENGQRSSLDSVLELAATGR